MLHCSTVWNLPRYKEIASNYVKDMSFSYLEQISLGRKYSVKDWVSSVYRTMSKRKDPITKEEITSLGPLASTRIISLREARGLPFNRCQTIIEDTCKELANSLTTPMLPHDATDVCRLLLALDEGILEWVARPWSQLRDDSARRPGVTPDPNKPQTDSREIKATSS